MRPSTTSWIAFAALLTPALAQQQAEIPRVAGFEVALDGWRAEHGSQWRALVDERTGHLELLYGGGAAPIFEPSTAVEGDWFALARHWVQATEALHGLSPAELVDERFVYLPMGMANGTDKITVRLSQQLFGVPVEGAKVNALFDTQGRLLSLHSTAAPATDGLTMAPAIGGRTAARTAVDRFEADAGVPAFDVGAPMLLFAQIERADGREAVLAYQVSVKNDDVPAAYRYTVDAKTGFVLRRDDLIHNFDVLGTINSNATPGTEADHAGNPPVPLPMSYINVSSSAGTVQTDRDGNFVFPGVNTPLDITVEYNGTFNNVNNQAGSDYTVTFPNVPANTPTTLLMNPTPGQQRTAQANAFQHVSVLRDFIRDTVPSDATADFKATSNPNISSTCNAFYNGSSVNYYLAGGGCNNTAFSSVVAHEMGHWLNDRYGTGNGSDGMGEGNADVFSMYVYDDPVVGRYFTTSGGFVRTGQNTRQFCGDCCGGCYGGVHADGEVWMGAAWKVRRNLKTTLGDALGGATADQLFVGWMNAYNQSQIKSIIETQWLTLDDDNANIDDGTPNYPDIDSGFREQGFPGFDLAAVIFSNVTDLPDVPSDSGPYTVDADIVAQFNPPVASPELNWRKNGGAWNTVGMSSTGGNGYAGDIPALGGSGFVEYYLTAEDASGNGGEYPNGGPDAPLEFVVGVPQVLAAWDFEAATDEGWQGGVPGDTATTGQWERGDPRGTAAQPEDDHTPGAGNVNCWFTGQGSAGGSIGENDVDNGYTTLRSPVLDMNGLGGVVVSYWRWYSNDEGSAPNADTFRVRLSLNGGATWTVVEVVGPGGDESSGGWFQGGFVVDAVGAPTSNVVFEFIAEDAGSGSIVEAAVDDVEITFLDGGCPAPINYCVGAPNSVGSGAVISAGGSQDVNDNNFTLFCDLCPANQFGFFFYGAGQQQVPAGDGFLCVAGQLFRLKVVKTDAFGFVSKAVDFTNLPPGGEILNGSTWNFQLGYRDNAGGPAGFNFSDGLSVQFCD